MNRVRRRTWIAVAAVAALAGGVPLYACSSSDTTTGITPITGIQIQSDRLVAGKGCGRDPGQIFKYTAVLYLSDASGAPQGDPIASATYDCFTDGLFQNLETEQYALRILAFNAAAYDAQTAAVTNAGTNAGAIAALKPTWTTSCTATQQSNIEVLAVCDPLALSAGDGSISVATGGYSIAVTKTTTLPDGGAATVVEQHGCKDPDGYTLVEATLLPPGSGTGTGDAGDDGGPSGPGPDAASDAGAADAGPLDAALDAALDAVAPADAGVADATVPFDSGLDGAPADDGGTAPLGQTKSATCPDVITFGPLPVPARFGVQLVFLGSGGSVVAHTSCQADTSPGVTTTTVCAPLTQP